MDWQGWRKSSWGGWGTVAVVALLLALLGPYGTFVSMNFPLRLVFWVVAAFILRLLVRGAMWLILRGLLPAAWPLWLKRAIAAVVAAVPGAYLIGGRLHNWVTGYHGAPFPEVYAYTVVPTVLAALVLPRWGGAMQAASPVAVPERLTAPPPDVGAIADAFVARVAPRLRGGRLLALEAEDHYLRIHTDRGSDLVLMRLRDAVAELAGVPGLQVHRSFWVAEAGVAQVVRRGQSWQVRVAGGLEVPVSRNYGARMRAAGWPERYAASNL